MDLKTDNKKNMLLREIVHVEPPPQINVYSEPIMIIKILYIWSNLF